MIKPSFFMDKAVIPILNDVKELLPESYPHWEYFINFINQNYPDINDENLVPVVEEIIKIKMDN